jgi:hypothetical protein
MLGGLYGSLPKAKEGDGGAGVDGGAPNNGATGLGAGGGWSAGAKALMQPVMRKPTPAASLGAPAAVLRAQKVAKPMPSPVRCAQTPPPLIPRSGPTREPRSSRPPQVPRLR